MTRRVLLIDSMFMAHRARHTTGELEFDGRKTGTIFGFLRDLNLLEDQFQPDRVVFAFDEDRSGERSRIYPNYKMNREKTDLTEEEKAELVEFYAQCRLLRRDLLSRMGYRNVWSRKGFEADDLIARCVEQLPSDVECWVVSADKDLWQLLVWNVRVHNPITGRTMTYELFKEEWGVEPDEWATVKAIAGDPSDNIIGVDGVGLKTAARFVRGEVTRGKRFEEIIQADELIELNQKLIRLPFPGTEVPKVKKDEISEFRRNTIYEEFGFRTIRRNANPRRRRKKR